MASAKAMLPFVTAEGGVAEALVELNHRLAQELGRGEFVALTLARYRPANATVELANAGAPDPYLVRAGKPSRPLSVPGPRLPLGIRSEVSYSSRTVEVAADESLLLLTDGLPEARDPSGEPLGYEALESVLAREPSGDSPSAWLSGLFDSIQQRTERDPEDDWTAVLLRPHGARPTP